MWENCHDYDPEVEKQLAEMREAAAACRAEREAREREENDKLTERCLELYNEAKADIESDPRMKEAIAQVKAEAEQQAWRDKVDAQLETPENRFLEKFVREVPMHKALREASERAGRELTDEEIRAKDAKFYREANEAWAPALEAAKLKDEPGRPVWMQVKLERLKNSAKFQRALYASGQWTNRNPDEILLEALVTDTVINMLYWDRLDDQDFTWEQMRGVIGGGGVSLKSLLNKFRAALLRTGLFEGQEGTYVGYKQD